jgi:hypothetical protein
VIKRRKRGRECVKEGGSDVKERSGGRRRGKRKWGKEGEVKKKKRKRRRVM